MPGYIIATLNTINDPDTFAAYQKSASTVFSRYGARFLVNSREVEFLDGDWRPFGVVVVEFESYEVAKEFYNSPEYQAIIEKRFDSSDSAVIITDGDYSGRLSDANA